MRSRKKVVDLVNSWVGKKEADGSYKVIIDIYNNQPNPPRGVKMQYGWAWCAATWSALAIKLGYTDIMPVEISCGNLINLAKQKGIWQEKDAYIPQPGDAVLYDWEDTGAGDNSGAPDHVGVVTYVNDAAGYMEVTEGNYSNSVKKRTVSLNGRYIRGFICPKYDADTAPEAAQQSGKSLSDIAYEVISGKWGVGDARKKALSAKGYDYAAVQNEVNRILNGSAAKPTDTNQDQPTAKKLTATEKAMQYNKSLSGTYKTKAALYMRNGAGTNKKALVLIPKGTKVSCYGYYNIANNAKWLYIQVKLDGTLYTGFSHSQYLSKI